MTPAARFSRPASPIASALRGDFGQSVALVALAAAFLWRVVLGRGILLALDLAGVSLPWAALPGAGVHHNPLLSDTLSQYYPWRHFFDVTLRSGVWPLWNPYILAGHPTFASINEQIFYPLNAFLAFLPADKSFGWLALAHLSIAGVGARAFAKLHLRDDASAFLAGVAFMFGGPILVWLEYPPFVSTMAWAGWLFCFLELLFRERRLRYSVLAGLAIGMELLGGQTQYSLYLALLAVAYVAARLVGIGRAQPRFVLPATGLAVLAAVIGGGLGAIAYAPALEFVALSHRTPMGIDQMLTSALPLKNAETFLLPNVFGSPARGDFVGFFNYNETTVYLGVLPLLLVALLPFLIDWNGRFALAPRPVVSNERGAQPTTRASTSQQELAVARGVALAVFAGAAVAALLLLFGWRPAVQVFWLLPPLRYFGLNRLAVVLPFAIGFMAGVSYARLPARGATRWWRTAWAFIVGGILAAAVVAVGLTQRSRPGPAAFVNHDLTLALALVGLSIAALIARVWSLHPGMVGTVLKWIGPLVLTADLFAFGYGYNTILNINPLASRPPAPLSSLPTGLLAPRSVGIPVDQIVLGANLGMLWDIPTPDGYVSEYLERYGVFVRHANPIVDELRSTRFQSLHPGGNYVNFAQVRSRYLDLLGVRYVVAPPNPELPDTFRMDHDAETAPLSGSTSVGAVFRARENGLNRIDVYPAIRGRSIPGWLALHLKSDPRSAKHLAYVRVDGKEIKDGKPLTFWFKPIANSAGRTFYFYLDAPDASPQDAVSLWYTRKERSPKHGGLFVDGGLRAGALSFAAYAVPLASWPKVAEANHTAVYENPGALPRAFVVQRVRVLSDDQFYAALNDRSLDPHRVAAVAKPPPSDLASALATGPNATALPVEVSAAGPQGLVLRTTLPRPGLLVVSNVWYPGWHASVDGVDRPVERVDAVFQGVYLSAGSHLVLLTFTSRSLRVGITLGLGAAILSVLGLALDVRFERGPVS